MLVLLDRKRLETPLPDVSAGMVVAMVSPHMRSQQPLHPAAQVAIAVRPQHQMKMVGYQTPSEHPHRQPLSSLLHQIEKRNVVVVLAKHFLARVATIEHMVANPAHRCPCRSRHAPILLRRFTARKRKSRMSPFAPSAMSLPAPCPHIPSY